MRYRVIKNKFFTSRFFTGGMYSLLMIMVSPVIADGGSSQYSVQRVAEGSNPWALPEKQESRPGYQQPYEYGQQYQRVPMDGAISRASVTIAIGNTGHLINGSHRGIASSHLPFSNH